MRGVLPPRCATICNCQSRFRESRKIFFQKDSEVCSRPGFAANGAELRMIACFYARYLYAAPTSAIL
jgi:hypothetical protein